MPEVEIGPVAGGSRRLTGYLAVPATPGPWPGVVAIHEAWGLDDVMRRQADRLAAAGFLALAPDLFSDGGFVRCIVTTMRSLQSGRGKAFADLDAAREWLARHDGCNGSMGLIGFCMGGSFALVMAAQGFDVASVNYGRLPRNPAESLAGSCPMVASYGRKDLSTRGSAAELTRILSREGVPHDVKEYPTAGHSFLNDAVNGPVPLRPLLRISNVKPDPVAAEDAWSRIESFFHTHLA